MKTHPYYLRAILGLLAVILVVSFLLSRPQGVRRDAWLPSSFNPASRGLKALYVTLDDLHWPVARWHKPYTELVGTGQCLVITRAATQVKTTFSTREIDQLLLWVQVGNHLVLAGEFSNWPDTLPFFKKTGFLIPDNEEKSAPSMEVALFAPSPEPITLEPVPCGSAAKPVDALHLEAGNNLPPPPPTAHILWRHLGVPYGVEIPWGQGSITFLSATTFFDNRNLVEPSNLCAAIEILRPEDHLPQKIWFEEAHHGYRLDSNVSALFHEPGLQLTLWLMTLGVLIFLGTQFVRFGPAHPLPRNQQRSSVDFINAMASLYRRSNQREEFIRELFAQTHAAILHRLDLPESSSHELISERLKTVYPQLPSWKKLAQRFTPTLSFVAPLPPAGWLKISRELITIKKEML